jgi:hypothetical protein
MTRGLVRLLRRNTIALLALFLALGGTTYAASTGLLGKNTVASPQVVNGSLQTKDLSKRARKALKGNRGLRGPAGRAGVQGAQGPKGATGSQGVQGPPGPTAGGVSPGDTGDAGAFCCFQQATITTTTTSNLLVMTNLSGFGVSCSSGGSCSAKVGAFLDDASHPIANAAMFLSAGASSTATANSVLSGIATAVPAGTHKVGIGWTTSGSVVSSGGGDNRSTVIALGATATTAPTAESSFEATPVQHGGS